MNNAPIKFAIICDLDPQTGRAKVSLPDEDHLVTDFLPIVQEETLKNQTSKTVSVGSHVVVALDDAGHTGAILGPYYPEGQTPPAGENIWMRQMEDGGRISYDPSKGVFHVQASKSVIIEAFGHKVTLNEDGIHLNGPVSIHGDLTVSGNTTLKNTSINGISQVGN